MTCYDNASAEAGGQAGRMGYSMKDTLDLVTFVVLLFLFACFETWPPVLWPRLALNLLCN